MNIVIPPDTSLIFIVTRRRIPDQRKSFCFLPLPKKKNTVHTRSYVNGAPGPERGKYPRVINTNTVRWWYSPLAAKVVSTRAPSSFAEDTVIECGCAGLGVEWEESILKLALYFLSVYFAA